jgi:PAS domain S-box-containing protein
MRANLRADRNFTAAVLDSAGALVVVLDSQGRIVRFNRACENLTGYTLAEVKGRLMWDLFLVPEEVKSIKALFANLLAGHLPIEHQNYWLTKEGSRRLIVWTYTTIADGEGTAEYVIGAGIDITERQQMADIENAGLYSQIERHFDELETLLAVQQAITSRLETHSVLQLVADAAHRLTATRLGIVYLIDRDDLRVAVFSGSHNGELFVGYRMPVADSVAGLAIQSGQAVIINDARDDPRLYADLVQRLGVRSYLAVPLFSNSTAVGVIAVADKLEGELGPDEERTLTMLAPGVVIGLENARLYQEEQTRRQEAEERRRVAESLRDILAVLNSNQPLDTVLDYIAVQITQLLGSDADVIYRLQAGKKIFTVQAARGLTENNLANIDIPLDNPILYQVISTHRPVAVVDVAALVADANRARPGASQHNYLSYLATNYRAILAVPLIIQDEVYGGIVLFYRQPRTFSEEEIALAKTYGDQVALAIENARLRQQAEQIAVAAERGRLARDLHDSVTQAIFSASLVAEVLPQIWQRNPDEAQQSLADLRHLTRGALAEMRALLLELRPAALLEAPLDDLLRQLTQAITARSQLHVTMSLDKAPELPPDVQVAFYRIAQEALNNVVKHAEAGQLILRLQTAATARENMADTESLPGMLSLCIEDDGCGFDLESVPSDRLGLGIMRERAEAIRAKLRIESRIDQGTAVLLNWQAGQKNKGSKTKKPGEAADE